MRTAGSTAHGLLHGDGAALGRSWAGGLGRCLETLVVLVLAELLVDVVETHVGGCVCVCGGGGVGCEEEVWSRKTRDGCVVIVSWTWSWTGDDKKERRSIAWRAGEGFYISTAFRRGRQRGTALELECFRAGWGQVK